MPHASIGAMADVTWIVTDHDGTMTPNGSHPRRPSDEERAFFDAIVGLRARYADRGADDATSVIGLHHVIASANAAMPNEPSEPTHRLGIARN